MTTALKTGVLEMLETGKTVTWPPTIEKKADNKFTPKEVKGKPSTPRVARMFETFLNSYL